MRYRVITAVASAAVMAAGLAGLAAAAGPAGAEKVEIASHRAVYELSMGRVRQGGNVTGVKGLLVMEWLKACSGWTVKQRLKLDLTDNEGGIVETDANFSSFESLDGLSYRFTSRNVRDGQVTEDLQGHAQLKSPGGPGTADFTQPEGTRFDLPKGTLFPTRHMEELIAAARRGEKVVPRTTFDGATLDGPIAVTAVIGGAKAKATAARAADALTNRPSWHMRLAFFPLSDSKAEPDYELGLRVYDNGIAEELDLDYGAFTVHARLERLEAIEEPQC